MILKVLGDKSELVDSWHRFPFLCRLFPGSPSVLSKESPRPFKCAIKISGAVIDAINFHAQNPNYHKEPAVQNTLFLKVHKHEIILNFFLT